MSDYFNFILNNADIDKGKPKFGKLPYNRVGLFVITRFSGSNTFHVLFARKCFGGCNKTGKVGERHAVGHTYHSTGKRVAAFGKYSGAAGTNPKFWGKWVSIGGTLSNQSLDCLHGAIIEFREEAGVNRDISSKLKFFHSFVNKSTNTMMYIAYLPPFFAKKLDTRRMTNSKLIKSSKGEIAELRWVQINQVNNSTLKTGVPDYVMSTYKRVYEYIKLFI